MKLQTSTTGSSYLLFIEQAHELTQPLHWVTALNKPVIVVVPERLTGATAHVLHAPLERERTERVKPAPKLLRSVRCQYTAPLTPQPPRRSSAWWKLPTLTVLLLILVMLALIGAGLGLLFLHLGPQLVLPQGGSR